MSRSRAKIRRSTLESAQNRCVSSPATLEAPRARTESKLRIHHGHREGSTLDGRASAFLSRGNFRSLVKLTLSPVLLEQLHRQHTASVQCHMPATSTRDSRLLMAVLEAEPRWVAGDEAALFRFTYCSGSARGTAHHRHQTVRRSAVWVHAWRKHVEVRHRRGAWQQPRNGTRSRSRGGGGSSSLISSRLSEHQPPGSATTGGTRCERTIHTHFH